MPKHSLLATFLGATLGAGACPQALAQADTSDSKRVGNMQFGNSLDPSGWAPFNVPDPLGMSWLHPGQLRTPSGVLYPYPHEIPDSARLGSTGWTYSWLVQPGYLSTSGDSDHAFFREYADWQDGLVLGLFAVSAVNHETGDFVQFRGSRISENDQYYRLRAGRYGSSRLEFFHRAIPHTLSTTAYPLWDGVGSTRLTLPDGLATGSTPEQVRAVQETRPRRTLSVTRRDTGVSLEKALTMDWIGYAGVSHERRDGERLWGGPMYLTYFYTAPGPGGVGAPSLPGRRGGQYQTVRPVDFTTTDINLGLRNKAGAWGWLFDLSLTGSFFRNNKDRLTFEVPFAVRPGFTSVVNGGSWSLEPDNDYYNVRLDASHRLKLWDGVFSLSAAHASMRQDDTLQAPINPAFCPDGQFIGTSGVACSDWNTTAALSRQTAEARIDTTLVDLRLDFRPTPKLGLHAHLRRHDENNMTHYSMYNPLTGQYGHLPENGSVPLMIPVPEFFDLFEPGDPAYQSVFTQISNIPFSYDRTTFELGGSYRLGDHNTISASYRFEHRTPHPRERTYVDDQLLELDWNGRVFGDATLRVSYEYEKRTGGPYTPNPYLEMYSPSIPGFVLADVRYTAFTVAQMRKYDLADLEANKLKAILIMPLGTDATLSSTVYGHRKDYGTAIGRQSFDTAGGSVSWDWAPTPATSMSLYAGYQASRLEQGNVNDN